MKCVEILTKNVEESARLSKHKQVKSKAKQCYRNAFSVVQYVPGYEKAWYVEGIAALGNSVPIEHGWVEKDGEILDPTLPHDNITYFPGLRFRGQWGLSKALGLPKTLKTDADLPFFYRFGWGGNQCPDFRMAWDDAWAYIRERTAAR